MERYWMRILIVTSTVLVTILVMGRNPIQPYEYSKRDTWTSYDSKSYAYDRLGLWRDKQMSCLAKLWGKESAWNPNAQNKIKVAGRNAGGIPQLLGLDPRTPPTKQIDRGLEYIYYRYHTPCRAWQHFKKKGWH